MAVIDITPAGFALVETADGVSAAEVAEATDAPLALPDTAIPTF
jgi:3-oxoacid CoA-transferase subunit B